MVPVGPPANPIDDPADAAALAGYAGSLLDAVDVALPRWIEQVVVGRWRDWSGAPATPELRKAAEVAAESARTDAIPALRALLETDIDEQRTNPLAILRGATAHATATLADAGVPPVQRDEQAERLLPDDTYDLGPAAFADFGPAVHDAGLLWGAAKAHVVLARRRSD